MNAVSTRRMENRLLDKTNKNNKKDKSSVQLLERVTHPPKNPLSEYAHNSLILKFVWGDLPGGTTSYLGYITAAGTLDSSMLHSMLLPKWTGMGERVGMQ